jgi:hypothetical protein
MLDVVPSLSHRLSALVLALTLAASPMAQCAGWMAGPEARMACCAGGGGCPMHAEGAHESSAPVSLSQADADRCCGAAEQDDASSSPTSPSSPTTLAFSAWMAMIAGPVPMVVPAAADHPDAWRTRLPLPGSPPAQHLLISVLLV